MTNKTRLRVVPLLSLMASLALAACASTGAEDEGSGGAGGSNASGQAGAGPAGSPGTGNGGSNTGPAGSGPAGSGQGGSIGVGGSGRGGSGPAGSGPAGSGPGGSIGAGGSGTGGSIGAGGAGRGGSIGVAGSGAGGSTTGAGGAATGTPSAENAGASCNATSAGLKKNMKLPNPFAMHDGTVITTKAQWECRRNEILKDLEKYEIGPKQAPPTVAATLSGKTLTVKVTTSAGSLTLTSTVSGSGSCIAIGMNGNAGIISGCTQIPFMHDNVIAYAGGTGSQKSSDPFYKVYPDLFGKIGNYSAWAWGISRLIDGIIQVKDQLNVDPTKIAVQGCSYAGKMALFGGALDERVALTVAEESGGGGITSWRTSQDFTTRTGVNIEKIDNTNYAWFMSSMKSLDPYSLPHDHHELIAMIAPRAIIALGNPGYEWLGDESGYKSVMAASEVFKAMGVADHIGYDFTGGHNHCAAPTSQVNSVKTFVDRYLKGGTGATNVAIKPSASNYQLDPSGVIDWTTPTLQ
jgi:hypothetical protein